MAQRPTNNATSIPRPVLLIENNPDVRHAMVNWLSLQGYTVHTAINGIDGLDKLHTGLRPCLILLHLHMPAMDGFEFRRLQLDDPQLARIPFVVYSGRYDPRIAAEILNATAYFFAPFDTDALGRVVEAHCKRRFGPRPHSKAA